MWRFPVAFAASAPTSGDNPAAEGCMNQEGVSLSQDAAGGLLISAYMLSIYVPSLATSLIGRANLELWLADSHNADR